MAHDLSFDEHLWRAILRTQCLQNDIPLLTYDLIAMNSSELEDAACQPYQFQHLLESEYPFHHRSRTLDMCFSEHATKSAETAEGITNVEVIPGGRYIVTTSESGWLRCWDLVEQCE